MFGAFTAPSELIPVGVSACLLGEQVRFDGGHKHNGYLTGPLARYFTYVPACPEVEAGMGVPRPTLRLVSLGEQVRAVSPKTGQDLTVDLTQATQARLDRPSTSGLRGFILQHGSPSCGLERVRVYSSDPKHPPTRDGRGIFAAALVERFPNLPVEESGRLNDPGLRENFVMRVFAYARWREMVESNPGPADLVRFHTSHKMLILAHDQARYRQLGPLVARAGLDPLADALPQYETILMAALSQPTTPGRHVNVLQHLVGFLRGTTEETVLAELREVIQSYSDGWVPLAVPMTMLRHHLPKAGSSWLEAQAYLDPYPPELGLRAQV